MTLEYRLTVDFFFTSRSTCWHVHVFMSDNSALGQIMMLETVFSIYLCLIQFSDGITYQNMISKAVNIETGSLPAAVQSMITSGPISTRSLIWVRNSFPKLVQMVLCKKEASNIFLILALTQIFPRPNSSTDKNNFDKFYKLAKNFLDFPLWEKRIAYFK